MNALEKYCTALSQKINDKDLLLIMFIAMKINGNINASRLENFSCQ